MKCKPSRPRRCQILSLAGVVAVCLLTTGCASIDAMRMESSTLNEPLQTNAEQVELLIPQQNAERKPFDVDRNLAASVGAGYSNPDWNNLPSIEPNRPAPHQPDESSSEHGYELSRQPVELLTPLTLDDFPVHNPLQFTESGERVFDTDKLSGRRLLWDRIVSDHANYYSGESLTWLTAGFAGGAVMANTSIDQEIRKDFQTSVRSASSDDWFEMLHAQKELGNGYYTLPVFAAAWAAGKLFDGTPIAGSAGEWGERSIRAILVGAPPMLAIQYVTGASRPGETSSGSNWKPFQDNNGVSGHSFMGAVPFLTAAKMTEKPLFKFAYYAGSTLAPLSRINDDKHFASQAMLGWWMAWIAVNAIDATQNSNRKWSVIPMPGANTSGIAVEYRW